MDVIGQPSYCDWRQRLHELVIRTELRITEAEHRIENHLKIWPLVATNGPQRRAHLELERNLLEGLKLLHTWRAMMLHELRSANLPRPTAHCGSEIASPTLRRERLLEIIAWLDELPITAMSKIIAEQRDRANRELWQIQKRRLWGE